MNEIINKALQIGLKVLIALVILIVSFKLINYFSKKLGAALDKKDKLDKTLTRSLVTVSAIGLKVLVVIALVGFLGIETSGFSALIASLGVGVGLAVNGTLSNLAGGAMLLITRPFSVGDFIEAQGQQGTVTAIDICYTALQTPDNKIIYIPNSPLSTGTIINYSSSDTRRIDITLSVAGNEPNRVKAVLNDVLAAQDLLLKDPAPMVRILDYGTGNGLKMVLRAYVKSADYWDAFFNLNEAVEKAFSENGIVIPFNQLDVHIKEK